uniref:Uncharacterized protein n=1 Tax=Glossina pallidipes TaxID=7398 RepID=A0A1A9Z3N7_GLOPL
MTTSLLFAWLTELIGVKQGRVILIQENDVVDGNAVQPPLGWNGSIKRVSRSQVAKNGVHRMTEAKTPLFSTFLGLFRALLKQQPFGFD